MTEKLYYKDAYIKDFSARVISVIKCEDGFDIVLDKTAFFPEAGGQTSDRGYIGSSYVFGVAEIGGVIHHFAKASVEVGDTLECSLDFDERFDKMQCHTAEHIVSGIFHKLYGVENTGFHLGADEVTFDTSLVMTKEQLWHVERLANEAIMKNAPVRTSFPSSDELKSLTYRSKLELTENVRIVDIEGYDSCACCAPHVAYTGEIGMIKFLDCVKHRGGSRIRMLAGMRAYDYMRALAAEAGGISVLLSAPVLDIFSETEKLYASREALRVKLDQKDKFIAGCLARELPASVGNVVVFYPELGIDALREFINIAGEKVSGTLVALCGEEGNYKYILKNSSADFASVVKAANAALSGKGGGKVPMAQGSYYATLGEIKKHFE